MHAVLPLYLHGVPDAMDAPPGLTLLQSIGAPESGGLDPALVRARDALLQLCTVKG